MPDRLKNTIVVSKFWNYWVKLRLPGFSSGEQCDFPAKITYAFRGERQKGSAVVRLERSGYNGGDIHLEAADPYRPETHHLDFSADYQTYEFDSTTHALIVCGQSEKMGNYRIVILPQKTASPN
jgi:hypothetical protein